MSKYLSFYANRWLDVWYAGELNSFFVIDYFYPYLPDFLIKFEWRGESPEQLIAMNGDEEIIQKTYEVIVTKYPTRTDFINEKIKSFRNKNTSCCYRNGKLHSLHSPAIVWPDGTMEWWMDGLRHNKNGPAVIRPDGSVEYWINGCKCEDLILKWEDKTDLKK